MAAKVNTQNPAITNIPFIFFWSTKDVPYGCFSNWYRSPFTIEDGKEFANTEQYFMWRKALLFDPSMEKAILAEKNPMKVKGLGRKVKNFDQKVWDQHRKTCMRDGLRYKFSDPALKKILMSTNDAIIAEASPKDKIWGIGLKADHRYAKTPSNWQGMNYLGQCLMELRTEFKNTTKTIKVNKQTT